MSTGRNKPKSSDDKTRCHLCKRPVSVNRRRSFKNGGGWIHVCIACHDELFTSIGLQRRLPPGIFGPGSKP